MTEKEFLDGLSCYGADLTRWPQPLRLEAERALSKSSALQEVQKREMRFEANLRRVSVEPVSDLLAISIVRRRAALPRSSSIGAFFARPAPVFAVLFLMGLLLGYVTSRHVASQAKSEVALNGFLYSEAEDIAP